MDALFDELTDRYIIKVVYHNFSDSMHLISKATWNMEITKDKQKTRIFIAADYFNSFSF